VTGVQTCALPIFSALRRLVAFLALPVRKWRVLARGDQFGVGRAMRIVASSAQRLIKRLAVVRFCQRLAFEVVATRAQCGLPSVYEMRGLAFCAAGQVVQVAGFTAHFKRAVDKFLLQLRRHRRMAAQTLVVPRSGADDRVSGSGCGRLLPARPPCRQ